MSAGKYREWHRRARGPYGTIPVTLVGPGPDRYGIIWRVSEEGRYRMIFGKLESEGQRYAAGDYVPESISMAAGVDEAVATVRTQLLSSSPAGLVLIGRLLEEHEARRGGPEEDGSGSPHP